MVLGNLGGGHAIMAGADSFKLAGSDHTGERFCVDALSSHVTRPNESADMQLKDPTSRPFGVSWHYAHRIIQL